MSAGSRILRAGRYLALAAGFLWACPFDGSLREYLSARFWLPFARRGAHFEKPNVRRTSAPYAGMALSATDGPLAKLRAGYQKIAGPQLMGSFDVVALRQAVAEARADQSLARREREEVDLIDAKIDMRAGQPEAPELLYSARKKLESFARTARTQEFRSEARGWLARVHYLLGDQAAAGKIYLDELNRNGSNLSRDTLLDSLALNYGYDGGPQLVADLDKYFDTPEHAAFAIQLATNPHWNRYEERFEREDDSKTYARIRGLLEKHNNLLQSNVGANALAILAMRTALRMGDPPGARKIAESVPADAAVRAEPDFHWMSASALFLLGEYAAAEAPLLALYKSARASENHKAVAAYSLCGVYRKTGNVMEQLRFAAWLHAEAGEKGMGLGYMSRLSDLSVYWAVSGWDLNLLLEIEAPLDVIGAFVNHNPKVKNIRLLKYSLAVRLARENRYEEAARIYESIGALRRVPRMRRMAALHEEANRAGLPEPQRQDARYKLAEYLSANSDRIYFNDALWGGFQRYVFQGSTDSRLTRAEREAQIAAERKLRDDQEERWRAYLILRDVTRDAEGTEVSRKAAALAVRCLRGIAVERFEREEEIRRADIEMSKLLRR